MTQHLFGVELEPHRDLMTEMSCEEEAQMSEIELDFAQSPYFMYCHVF